MAALKSAIDSQWSDITWGVAESVLGAMADFGTFDHGYFSILIATPPTFMNVSLVTGTPDSIQLDAVIDMLVAIGYNEPAAKDIANAHLSNRSDISSSAERTAFGSQGYILGDNAAYTSCITPEKVLLLTISGAYAAGEDPSYTERTVLAARSDPNWLASQPCR